MIRLKSLLGCSQRTKCRAKSRISSLETIFALDRPILCCSCSFPIDICFNGKGNGICVPNELKCFVHIYPEILLSVIFSVKLKHFTHTHTVAQRHSQKDIHTLTYSSSHTLTLVHTVNDTDTEEGLWAIQQQQKIARRAKQILENVWWWYCYYTAIALALALLLPYVLIPLTLACCWNAFVCACVCESTVFWLHKINIAITCDGMGFGISSSKS